MFQSAKYLRALLHPISTTAPSTQSMSDDTSESTFALNDSPRELTIYSLQYIPLLLDKRLQDIHIQQRRTSVFARQIYVTLPMVDRGRSDPRNTIGVIIDRKNDIYRIAVKIGFKEQDVYHAYVPTVMVIGSAYVITGLFTTVCATRIIPKNQECEQYDYQEISWGYLSRVRTVKNMLIEDIKDTRPTRQQNHPCD
ncbi:unnamed protein product [Lepeophtheirus salmonis]|uniref:(salmon louse) hypothetical protein n=1 Tax=Lepeophtheirus salmonis TaxID=72036 RepID=A0A7R8D252_LEPSM|nr:unnamed protein product [Lepeophtheirus salmonis]CAF3002150.1 unnamed protein product [Lepeophtheirus salmonis]